MSDDNVKGGSDCECGSGDCCSAKKGGWRGTAGLIVTVAILVAAGLVVARGLLGGGTESAEKPTTVTDQP